LRLARAIRPGNVDRGSTREPASAAEPLPPIGFRSYTSSDDSASRGWLGQLRPLLADQLRLLVGRRQPVRIWQDVTAIPHGVDWLKEIHKALGESSFLIPIVTPAPDPLRPSLPFRQTQLARRQ